VLAKFPGTAWQFLRPGKRVVWEYLTAARTLLFRNRAVHWRRVATGGVPPWDARNQLIAAAIPDNSSVVDLGCGAQTLRHYLRPGCTYKGFDLVANLPSVEFCDLNAGVYPRIETVADYVVCSGLLEYIFRPPELLSRIGILGRTVCLSYNALIPGETKRSRLAKAWVNHITQTELEQMFTDLDFTWRVITIRPPSEVIYMLARKGQR